MIRVVRRAFRTAAFVAGAGGVLPIHAAHELLTPDAERDDLKERYKHAWCGAMLKVFGIEVRVLGTVPVPPSSSENDNRGLVIVANHRSAIDIAIMFHTFGGHMLSRGDISGWPLLGTMAKKIGTVFVDRESKKSGAAALNAVVQLLKRGRRVTIFAEGTTFAGDEVHPFHPGAFAAARRAHVPVLPVGIAYDRGSEAAYVDETFLHHLGRVASAPPSGVTIAIGEPVEPRSDIKAFSAAVKEAVTAQIARARREDPSR